MWGGTGVGCFCRGCPTYWAIAVVRGCSCNGRANALAAKGYLVPNIEGNAVRGLIRANAVDLAVMVDEAIVEDFDLVKVQLPCCGSGVAAIGPAVIYPFFSLNMSSRALLKRAQLGDNPHRPRSSM